MDNKLEKYLDQYANLVLKVGLNLQKGQRLKIGGFPGANIYQVPFEAAPLVRKITAKAYQMGTPLVEVFWGDEKLDLLRYEHAPKDSFQELSTWVAGEMETCNKRGDAGLIIFGHSPYNYLNIDSELLSIVQKRKAEEYSEIFEYIRQNPCNWNIIAYPTPAWASAVFPDLPVVDAVSKLWEYVIQFCRLDSEDPTRFWTRYLKNLKRRKQWLTESQFKSLHLYSSTTDLKIQLPKGHLWNTATLKHRDGFEFVANLPTEEVFTMPDRMGVDGYVQSTKPFTMNGLFVDGMQLEFKKGKVNKATAKVGDDVLGKTLEVDDGACHLGEVALVPHSSPISQTNQIFQNVLFDENASVHLALGLGFRFCMTDGENMNSEEFISAGGNISSVHYDFMIGSAEMNVDGIKDDGTVQPLMRNGEWAYSID